MKQTSATAAVILVGGLGTRLRPLTLHRPKALMPIFNRPFLSYQFEILKKAGIRNVILAANPAFKSWKKALQRICPAGLRLDFAFEKTPLGTGGAIRFGSDELQQKLKNQVDTFVVLNGDVLVDLDLTKVLTFHRKNKSFCTLVLKKVSDVSRFGLVQCGSRGQVQAFLEKPKNKRGPGAINAGIYVIEASMLLEIPKNKNSSVERDIFPQWLKQGEPVFGFVTSGYWNDIGTPLSYLQAHRDLFKAKSVWTGKGFLCKGRSFSMSPQAKISGMVCVGSQVSIEKDCLVEDSVLMDDVRVDQGAQLKGVVLGRACRIGKFSVLREGTVLGDRTIIPPYSKI